MKRILNGNDINVSFESLMDFKRYIDANENKGTKLYDSHREGKYNWYKTHNFKEFREDILINGDTGVTAKVRDRTKYYIDRFEHEYIFKSEYNWAVAGDFFDVGTMLSGEPEHWIVEHLIQEEKFITINVNGTYHAEVDADDVIDNAGKMLGMAVALQELGFLVRINMEWAAKEVDDTNDETNLRITLPIKDYDEILDYKKMATLLHPSTFRRGVFRVMEVEIGNNLNSGYGRPIHNQKGVYDLANKKHVDNLEKRLKDEKARFY